MPASPHLFHQIISEFPGLVVKVAGVIRTGHRDKLPNRDVFPPEQRAEPLEFIHFMPENGHDSLVAFQDALPDPKRHLFRLVVYNVRPIDDRRIGLVHTRTASRPIRAKVPKFIHPKRTSSGISTPFLFAIAIVSTIVRTCPVELSFHRILGDCPAIIFPSALASLLTRHYTRCRQAIHQSASGPSRVPTAPARVGRLQRRDVAPGVRSGPPRSPAKPALPGHWPSRAPPGKSS